MATQPTYPDPFTRMMLTIASTAAVMMVTIDATIAIIALPRIGSSLAASQEQITWILTSYLVASAIATPLSGWLANRFGRNRVITVSIVSFTLASIGCGLSPTLEVLVQCPTKELRDTIIDSGMEGGMQEAFDALERVAASLS